MVVLVVLRAERLEKEVICNEAKWRLKVVRDEDHLDIVARLTSSRPKLVWGRPRRLGAAEDTS